MKIAIDVDGVLINLMAEFLCIYNEEYDDNKQYSDVKRWSFYEDFGITREQCFEIFHKIDIMDVLVIESDVAQYLDIIQKKHDVDIVTARRESDREILTAKLESMGIYKGKQYNKLVIVDYQPHTAKLFLDYDVYVDDSPELAKALLSQDRTKIIILYDQPWNQKVVLNEPMHYLVDKPQGVRVVNWLDVLYWLKTIPCTLGN